MGSSRRSDAVTISRFAPEVSETDCSTVCLGCPIRKRFQNCRGEGKDSLAVCFPDAEEVARRPFSLMRAESSNSSICGSKTTIGPSDRRGRGDSARAQTGRLHSNNRNAGMILCWNISPHNCMAWPGKATLLFLSALSRQILHWRSGLSMQTIGKGGQQPAWWNRKCRFSHGTTCRCSLEPFQIDWTKGIFPRE